MSNQLVIAYYASQDTLGVTTDEEYGRFKDLVVEAFQEEWPDAMISVEDDEESHLDIDGVSGQAEVDVRARVEDIVSEVINAGDWQNENDDFFPDDDSVDADPEEGDL
ncbi:MAG TPA: hypothetical protein VMP00_10580 [Burkholderiales bacterium]|nr:hypothetical protein [Burkholderiales bacterium]